MSKTENKLKVMTIFGTRPEIIKLSRLFAELDRFTNHIMVHTGQSYDFEMNQVFFDELKIRKPNYFLGVQSETLHGQIAKIIEKGGKVLEQERPDAVLIFGDTNSGLIAIIAKRMKIPIFHMEAGNRCFDENVPEEVNRKIIDHISDINLVFSEQSRNYLLLEGLPAGSIFVTGSPQLEVLTYHEGDIAKSKILKELDFKKGQYIVWSTHREENVDSPEALKKLAGVLNVVAEKYGLPIIVTTHPRTKKRLNEAKFTFNKLVNFHKPFGVFDYATLLKSAFCVISDSGTAPEEAALFHVPTVQVRSSSERPEAQDEGVFILAGLDEDIILSAIEVSVEQKKEGRRFNIPKAYGGDTNFSSKVLRLVLGYAKIIKNKRTVK